jgi:DNA (cytosine-5)-methyltransferase 1
VKALDLFCCAGGVSKGLNQAGFEVTGVDIESQPEYPYKFIQADATKLSLDFLRQFDFIWASPPCQLFSTAYTMNISQGKGKAVNLIPQTRKLLEESGVPFVIENIPRAPLRKDLMLCGTMFDLGVFRHRVFEASFKIKQPIHPKHNGKIGEGKYYCITQCGWDYAKIQKWNLKEWQKAMGIFHITKRKSLAEAIPPDYALYIAKCFLKTMEVKSGCDANDDGIPPRTKVSGILPN